MKKNGPVIEG